MVNRIVLAGAVALIVLLCACETEIERKARMRVELAQRKRQEALDALEEVKGFAATKNPNDPAQIIQVIEKLQSPEMQGKMTAVESDIESEYKKILHEWNDKYLALCGDAWRSAKRAASDALKAGEYDKALAALDKYPEGLRTFAHEYWGDLERYKEAIAKMKEAPGKAFETITEAEAAVAKGNYPGAIEVCVRALRLLVESNDTLAVRIVVNEHIYITDRWVDEIAKSEGTEAALEKLGELCSAFRSTEHNFYLMEKSRELSSK